MGELGEGGRSGVGGVGSEGEGEVGVHSRGESCSFPSSVPPLSNSTSQRHFTAFLVRLAGGGEAGGERATSGASSEGNGGGADSMGEGH